MLCFSGPTSRVTALSALKLPEGFKSCFLGANWSPTSNSGADVSGAGVLCLDPSVLMASMRRRVLAGIVVVAVAATLNTKGVVTVCCEAVLSPGDVVLFPGLKRKGVISVRCGVELSPGDVVLFPDGVVLLPGVAVVSSGDIVLPPGDVVLSSGDADGCS